MSGAPDLHVSGGTLLPMTGDREWTRGDLVISGGRLSRVTRGPAEELADCTRIDASNCVVLPGFVQCHVHVVQSLLRHHADAS